jgi:hypothetical protein
MFATHYGCVCKHTYCKENAEALVITGKEISLEVNAEKIKYMVMSSDQNAGQNSNLKAGKKSFERVEQCKHLGTTPSNENSIHEEIRIRSKSGNACCHSVQNLLSCSFLKSSVYRATILPCFIQM